MMRMKKKNMLIEVFLMFKKFSFSLFFSFLYSSLSKEHFFFQQFIKDFFEVV